MGFEPSQASVAGADASTAVCPANLAVGSGHAVLEFLGWLSEAALKKMEGKNASDKRKTTTQEEGGAQTVPGSRDGQTRKEEERQQTDYSDGRGTGTQEREGEVDGVFVRRCRAVVAGGSAVPDGRKTGRGRVRSRGERMASGHKKGEPAGCTAPSSDVVDNVEATKERSSQKGDMGNNQVTSSASNGNSNSGSGSSSASRINRRRDALPPDVVVMMTTAVVSSSAFCSSSSFGCSCSSICWCSRSRSRRRFWSSPCLCSVNQSGGNGCGGGSAGGGGEEEGPQVSRQSKPVLAVP